MGKGLHLAQATGQLLLSRELSVHPGEWAQPPSLWHSRSRNPCQDVRGPGQPAHRGSQHTDGHDGGQLPSVSLRAGTVLAFEPCSLPPPQEMAVTQAAGRPTSKPSWVWEVLPQVCPKSSPSFQARDGLGRAYGEGESSLGEGGGGCWPVSPSAPPWPPPPGLRAWAPAPAHAPASGAVPAARAARTDSRTEKAGRPTGQRGAGTQDEGHGRPHGSRAGAGNLALRPRPPRPGSRPGAPRNGWRSRRRSCW